MGHDVIYELGLFLQAVSSEFTPEQRLQIEETILNLPAEDKEDRESLEVRRNLLLAQIPPNLLLTLEARNNPRRHGERKQRAGKSTTGEF